VATVRELARKIKAFGDVRLDEPMSRHTSFRIGGPADIFAVPATAAAAAAAAALASREGMPVHLLGGGTNILVADRGIRGLVVDLGRLAGIEEEGGCVSALCGTPISAVAEFALARGLAGLEFAYRLPGSVGGAVWMNARCYDRQASDVLEFVETLAIGAPADGTAPPPSRRLAIVADQWGYKRSPLQDGGALILRAGFRLHPGDPARIGAEMKDHGADREQKGHFLHPCAGSVFKNDRRLGAPTGKIIDSLGLKGRRAGGAQIAPFHGNIIVNTGGATAADVLSLIELVESEVERQLGFPLEREVILVGDWGTPG
jgi:UDP-N-acetylmuramate dehydrogenase